MLDNVSEQLARGVLILNGRYEECLELLVEEETHLHDEYDFGRRINHLIPVVGSGEFARILFDGYTTGAHFNDVWVVYHFEILDFAGDSCFGFRILGINSRLTNTFKGDSLTSEHMYSHCRTEWAMIDEGDCSSRMGAYA
jgi:hypothetical protein